MILAGRGIMPPREWWHYPWVSGIRGTVEDILIKNNMEVPDELKVVNKFDLNNNIV